MSDETKKDLINQGAGTVATVPAPGRGHDESLEHGDYEIPRARIIQFTSEEAQAEDEKERIPPGRFINGLTKEEIAPVFIPIKAYKSYTQWNPRKKDDPNYDPAYEPGALIFSTFDRHDSRITSTRIMQDRDGKDVEVDGLSFGPNQEYPAVTEAYNFLCIFEGQSFPLVLTFQKTSHRAGKKLNTMLRAAGGDVFSNKFKLVFTQAENNGTKYYTMDVRAYGKANAEEFSAAEKWFNSFKGKDVTAKVQPEAGGFTE